MTRVISRDGHATVHGLALRTGCACPDCGRCAPRRVTAFEEDAFDDLFDEDGFDEFDEFDDFDEDADYAARRAAAARRAPARPARPARPVARAVARPPARRPARPVARTPRPAARTPRPAQPRRPAARRAARTRRPFPQPAPLTPVQRDALTRTVGAFGWTGFQPGGGPPVTMQDLVDFQGGGGVTRRMVRGKQRMVLTPQGRQMLRDNPRFRKLAPLFTPARGQQRIYEIAPAGQLDRPHYVGKTGRRPGERLLEHLHWGRDRAHAELKDAQQQGRLSQLQVADGRFTAPDLGRRSHLGEVALMELTNPDWNDPRRHGFEEAADAFAW